MSRPRQDYCQRGHEFSGENVYVIPSTGQRVCVACRKRSKKSWEADSGWRAAAIADHQASLPSPIVTVPYHPAILTDWPLTMCAGVVWQTVRDEEIFEPKGKQ